MSMKRRMAVAVAALAILTTQKAAGQATGADEWLTRPVGDAEFRSFVEFFAYNAQLPFDDTVLESAEEQGVVREHLRFVSTPGVQVTAHLYRSAPAAAVRGGVILLHGGGAAGKNAANMAQLGRLMARDGWTVLAIDMLHYGERTTGLFSGFSNEEKSERLYNAPATYLEFVTQTVKDVRRSFDYLVRARGVDAGRVVLIGMSRGAVLATIAGAAEPRFAGVALLHGGHVIMQEHGHPAAACPANYVGRIGPRPMLLINSQEDVVFDPASSIRPFQRLLRPSAQLRWTSGPHGFLSREDHAALLTWLRTVAP